MAPDAKRILVAGLGKSGLAVARLGLARGYRVDACDLLPEEDLPPAASALKAQGLSVHAETQDPTLLKGADILVLSPGVPRESDLVQSALVSGIEVQGELEWAFRHALGTVVAVTGSNGKSTTTSLLGEILSAHFPDVRTGGNLGTPFADMVEGSTGGTWFVLEASSFQLESISSFRAHLSILLNITPDHQDRYGRYEDYQEAKGRIFLNQEGSDFALYLADDPRASRFGEEAQATRLPFTASSELAEGAFLRGDRAILSRGGREEEMFRLEDLPLPGRHNLENALAACAAALCAGVPKEMIPRALAAFRGLPHRLELVAERGGVRVYNDSKATNTDSVAKALSAFESGVILLLGGKDKGADWPSLLPDVKRRCRAVVAFGGAREKVEKTFAGQVPLESFACLSDATFRALAMAGPGDSVVLSPACASFDEFRNFEHRGDRFRAWAREWQGAGG